MRPPLRLAVPLAACLVAWPPAPALGQARLFRDFRDDGTIDPCRYSPGELRRGREALPPDLEQYAPGLADQLNNPCVRGAAPAPTPRRGAPPQERQAAPVAPTPRRRADVPRPPRPRPGAGPALAGVDSPGLDLGPSGADAPGWLVALLALVAAGGLGTGVAVRYGALDPQGLARSLRASVDDAFGRR